MMKSLMHLWRELANELASLCCTSAVRDYKTVTERCKHEGVSFLTITLPAFAKDFERSLELGKTDHASFVGFRRRGGLPLFLGGFLDQVFDRETGVLLDDPSIDCILSIRQLTMLYGKILLECSDARKEGAMRKYIECENDVREADRSTSLELREEFRRMAALIFGDVLQELDNEVYHYLVSPGARTRESNPFGEKLNFSQWDEESILLPKHGPGATADRLKGNQKFDQVEWPARLNDLFPFEEWALPSVSYYEDLERVHIIEPEDERPVRVITVPKTLKTPRIIAVEPTCMQYMQQAFLRPLVQKLEQGFSGQHSQRRPNLAFGFVGFTDQDPNRVMACDGSLTGKSATLDMSEASDRVSNQHVIDLLARWPSISEAVQAVRSTKADVPGVGVITLAKHASMGSALCFPMEAMVFTTIVFMGIQASLSTRFTRRDILSLRGEVRVYGDDILIPVDSVRSVVDHLEAFGLKVNVGKSFWNGKFRESCGGDYYDGTDVTPVRFRREFPSTRKHVSEIVSLVEFRNHMYNRGLWQTARWLDNKIARVLPRFPIVEPTSSILGRTSVSFSPLAEKVHRHLHTPLVEGYVVRSVLPKSSVSGTGALMKFFLRRGDEPFADVKHLDRAGRPLDVNMYRGWHRPY
jgi:hypothetical protein